MTYSIADLVLKVLLGLPRMVGFDIALSSVLFTILSRSKLERVYISNLVETNEIIEKLLTRGRDLVRKDFSQLDAS